MTIQVTGVLRDPLNGVSSNTHIRVVSQVNDGDTLASLPASTYTDDRGLYNFQMVNGTHSVEVNLGSEYQLAGTVVVGTLTPSPISLPALLNL